MQNYSGEAHQVDKRERAHNGIKVYNAKPGQFFKLAHVDVGKVLGIVGKTFGFYALLCRADAYKISGHYTHEPGRYCVGERIEEKLPVGNRKCSNDKKEKRGHDKPYAGKVVLDRVFKHSDKHQKNCEHGDRDNY
jgi:hypothetical protein